MRSLREGANLPRLALFATVALFWLNYALTARWAGVAGSLHGSKQIAFVALLAVTTVLLVVTRRPARVRLPAFARLAAAAGLLALVVCFFIWFPTSTWTAIPFHDNWPARFQSTVESVHLLVTRGTLVGWQWNYLGGYHTSSDVTVTLTASALLPMLALGDRIGFHATHLLLFLSIPLLAWADFLIERRDRAGHAESAPELPWLILGLTCVSTLALSYGVLSSGDTNSLAALAATMLALFGSHAAASGRRWGSAVLAGGLTLVAYSHAGFLVYAAVLLAVEAWFYRDSRRLVRGAVAWMAAVVAVLPLTWESWRYPHDFLFNNVLFDPSAPVDAWAVVRKIYYNVEILFRPGRWLNDYTGLAAVCLPLTVVLAAARGRARAGFYAAAILAVFAMTRLNVPELGYAFARPAILLAAFVPAVVAAFALEYGGSRLTAIALLVTAAVYLQVRIAPVPHIQDVAAYQPALVDAVRQADGALVLVENTFHRDMIAAPGATSEPTPFPGHFQSLLAEATGQRLYAGVWDGWQWMPWRGELVAGGAWQGRAIGDWPHDRFISELRRWGIRHLFVIHEPTRRYLDTPAFVRHHDAGPYAHFELLDADTRSVVTPSGSGRIASHDPLGARVALVDVHRGDRVIVRTHFYPAWHATASGQPVPLFDVDGQLAFDAPAGGSYVVQLVYPRRLWLWPIAALGLAGGVFGAGLIRARQQA